MLFGKEHTQRYKETDGEVGVANTAVLEAIVQSSDSGRAVDVKR